MDDEKGVERLSAVLTIKVKPSTLKLINQASLASGTDKADFVRRALDEKINGVRTTMVRLDKLTDRVEKLTAEFSTLEAIIKRAVEHFERRL